MSWAVAVCIDLTCVLAARERQRDKRLPAAATRQVSWPGQVLAGGVLLSLAANLAQAQPTAWGRITAATPCGAFLIAVSLLGRRASHQPAAGRAVPAPDDARDVSSWPGRPSRQTRPRNWRRPPAAPLPSTRPATGSRSPATRCAPGWASPTRPPPACSAPLKGGDRPTAQPARAGAPGPRQVRRRARMTMSWVWCDPAPVVTLRGRVSSTSIRHLPSRRAATSAGLT
jgi:hypothetical protein